MQREIRIIMADDHFIFRDGFKLLLKNLPEMSLLAEAENGKELLEQVETFKPDLVFTDIKMPIMDGIEACRLLTNKYPDIGVIALSMFNDDYLIMDMLQAGAQGYLLKNTTKEELRQAAQTVMNKGKYFCNATSMKLAKMIAESRFNPYRKAAPSALTEREIEIIKLICDQSTNKEIADKLALSVRTIESHRERILEKINAKNIVGVVLYAVRHGIVPID